MAYLKSALFYYIIKQESSSKEHQMILCLKCGEPISNWSQATGKTIKVNGILYHTACITEARIKDIEEENGKTNHVHSDCRQGLLSSLRQVPRIPLRQRCL